MSRRQIRRDAGAAKAAKATQEIKIRFIVSLLVQDASASFSLMFACNAIREVTAIVATGFRSWLGFPTRLRFEYAMRVLLRARIRVLLSRANDLGFRAKRLLGAAYIGAPRNTSRSLGACAGGRRVRPHSQELDSGRIGSSSRFSTAFLFATAFADHPAHRKRLLVQDAFRSKLAVLKVSDEFTMPLCRAHHRELHEFAKKVDWWARMGVEPIDIALKLWAETRSLLSEVGGPAPPGATADITARSLYRMARLRLHCPRGNHQFSWQSRDPFLEACPL